MDGWIDGSNVKAQRKKQKTMHAGVARNDGSYREDKTGRGTCIMAVIVTPSPSVLCLLVQLTSTSPS